MSYHDELRRQTEKERVSNLWQVFSVSTLRWLSMGDSRMICKKCKHNVNKHVLERGCPICEEIENKL
jgi:rubrerythrin